jgi:hypothetical protein
MSILCAHKEVSGADLIRLIARASERELKHSLDNQEPEPKQESKALRNIGIGLILFLAAYMAAHLLIWVVR